MNLENAKIIIETVFYCVTGTAVLVGLGTWKAALKGRAKYNTAKNVIAGAYRVRDAIKACQSPMMTPGEWASREASENETENEKDTYNSHYAYSRRFDHVIDEVSAWYPSIVESEALFGPGARELTEKIEHAARRLRTAIDMHHRTLLRHEERLKEIENILYGINPSMASENQGDPFFQDDGFQKNIDEAIEGVRDFFIPFIR